MIDLGVWECRERQIRVRHSVWRKKQSSALNVLRLMRLGPSIIESLHARILSHACCLVSDAEGRIALSPLLTTLDGKSGWKGDLHFFFFADGDLSKCLESTLHTQRRHGDKRAIQVPYLRDYCLFHAQYDTMYILIIWPLPVAFNCRQLLKVRADRRKNGRLRKYHYSKIQNAGDCVARTGVREKGFEFGSLPHDPGGITCMRKTNHD